jgi:hypothetical protein
MSPIEYQEARAALLRAPVQVSKPQALPDDKHASKMSPEEYAAARSTYLHGA